MRSSTPNTKSSSIKSRGHSTPLRAGDFNTWRAIRPRRCQLRRCGDVAEAIATALQLTGTDPTTFECGGPRVYTYEELLRAVAHEANIQPILIPIPFAAWHALAWIAELLPNPPINGNQVDLMQIDNVSSPEMPGFGKLGILPHSIEEILHEILSKH